MSLGSLGVYTVEVWAFRVRGQGIGSEGLEAEGSRA